MADFLSSSISGLNAFRRALDVTSHNIANVATEGYSRQRVNLATGPAQQFGNGYVGSGVRVTGITRTYDDFLALGVRNSSSSYQRFNTYAELTGRVDNMFSDTDSGLSAQLQKFTNAVQEVATSPTSSSARQVLLSQATSLSGQLQNYNDRLNTIGDEVNSRIESETRQISTIAQGIAELNNKIKDAYGRTGQPPNDLLDQRDKLLDDLSTHLNVNTSTQDGQTINVFVGNGQPLVIGATASTIATAPDSFDATQNKIVLQTANGFVDISNSVSGGVLGGLTDFREEVLEPARNSLGRMSVALADVVNAQNRSGLDASGNLGQDIFSTGPVDVLHNRANTGTATITATRTNISGLTENNYILEQTSSGFTLKNKSTGASVPFTGTGTSANPILADGMSIVVGGTAAVGDQFQISPTRTAASGFDVVMTNPSGIATASPVKVAAGSANTGNGTIALNGVTDPTNPALRSATTIQFTSATTYSINGAGSFTYTAGSAISVNGLSVTVSGTPASGDSFTIADNAGASGDNTNAQKLADALNTKVLDGGTKSIGSVVDAFIGKIGVATQQAQVNRDAQETVYNESVDERDSVSGVNLDEEAANMLRYQQAYQAAAQLIQVANTIFQSLLNATSR
jgi:flagellar hook-associated protein 1 FlgK